ncbi:MAG: MlaE family lipid ABC transporter permease subunit [Bacteroidota bacterium]
MSNRSSDTNAGYSIKGDTLYLKDNLEVNDAGTLVKAILDKMKGYSGSALEINLDFLEEVDSTGVVAIQYIKHKLEEKGLNVEITGGSEDIKESLDTFRLKKEISKKKEQKSSFFLTLGENAHYIYFNFIKKFFELTADVFFWAFHDLFDHSARRRGESVNQAVQIGVNAILIVGAMSFIIGMVLALQSASQLRNFGADVFIVDLTVLAMMGEMGPLITAILIAGRSGSSIAAEIATMKVTSELDALKTMGLNPIRFVVVPKLYGCLSTMPFLTILANVLGIAGGMLTAYLYLEITPEIFINRMEESLFLKDIVISIIKSLVFATLIVLTGSFYGFRVERGAEGVGKVTTFAVVLSLSLVIIADSIMGLLFY